MIVQNSKSTTTKSRDVHSVFRNLIILSPRQVELRTVLARLALFCPTDQADVGDDAPHVSNSASCHPPNRGLVLFLAVCAPLLLEKALTNPSFSYPSLECSKSPPWVIIDFWRPSAASPQIRSQIRKFQQLLIPSPVRRRPLYLDHFDFLPSTHHQNSSLASPISYRNNQTRQNKTKQNITINTSAIMFSRSVRAVSGRVLANAVRPTVMPAARQIAPAVAVVAKRSYHEKVLDREYSHRGHTFAPYSTLNMAHRKTYTDANMSQYQTTRALATSVPSTRRTSRSAKASSAPPPAVMSCAFTSRSTPRLESSATSSSRPSAAALPCEYCLFSLIDTDASGSHGGQEKVTEVTGDTKSISHNDQMKRERRQNSFIDIWLQIQHYGSASAGRISRELRHPKVETSKP